MKEELDIVKFSEPIRAARRRKKENAIKKALRHLSIQSYVDQPVEETLLEAKRRADNFVICSCHMCGNPRRNYLSSVEERMPIKERREWSDMTEQYKEFDIRIPRKRAGKVNGFRR